MDISRIISVMCVFLLSVCLILSIGTLTVLRNAVDESNRACREAQAFLETMGDQLKESEPPSEDAEVDNSIPADVLYEQFCMREVNGRIAIYTADGYLIRLLDVSVKTLPEADQAALREGICVSSWKEILALMQDFGS